MSPDDNRKLLTLKRLKNNNNERESMGYISF